MQNETIELGTQDECQHCGGSIIFYAGSRSDKWGHEIGKKFAGRFPIVDDMCPIGKQPLGKPFTYAAPKTS